MNPTTDHIKKTAGLVRRQDEVMLPKYREVLARALNVNIIHFAKGQAVVLLALLLNRRAGRRTKGTTR